MAKEIVMPKLGLTMSEGKVAKWHKEVGDEIAEGDVIFEVETEKITNEVEASSAGQLANILAQEGTVVPVTEVVAVMAEAGEDIDDVAADYAGREISEQDGEDEDEIAEEVEEKEEKKVDKQEKNKKIKASPKAKKTAKEKGVAIEEVAKVAEGARITSDDVEEYLETQEEEEEEKIRVSPKAKRAAKEKGVEIEEVAEMVGAKRITSDDIDKYLDSQQEEEETAVAKEETGKTKKDLSQMRMTIANRLSASWDAPHVYLRSEVEVDKIIELKEKFKEVYEEAPSLTDIINKAVITSLKQHPNINATWEDGEYYTHDSVNLGLAVAVEEGLVVPVINQAEEYSIKDLSAKAKKLVKKGRANNLALEEMQGGTFTISNLGMYGIDEFTAIINPPEVAILAVGTIKEVLYKTDEGDIAEKKVMNFTLGLDHRAIDGAQGAEFLQTLQNYIENPALML